ncbi:MAG: VOC family protein [Gemmatimonadetes bacterium]|nr:VOC family protein [Gemmatimonadota bacterium]
MSRLSRVDHLVYGTPDLEDTVDRLERQTGVRAEPGGQHLGHGTRNALIALGPATYLEIMGPDPEQPEPDEPRWLGIDDLDAPRLVTWAATASPLAPLVEEAAARGIAIGRVQPGHRRRPDGADLHWELTDPSVMLSGGLVPFFIDWGSGPHPSDTAPGGVTLKALWAEHPEPGPVLVELQALNLNLEVQSGRRAALVAILECPKGTVELR